MLTQLLDNNLTLIETLSMEHVQTFVRLIRAKGKQTRFLDFLRALCSCKGAGVPIKQELICDIIFGDSSGHYSQLDRHRLGVTTTDAAGADIVMPVSCSSGRLMVAVEDAMVYHDPDVSTASPGSPDRPQWRWISLPELYAMPSFALAAQYFSSCVQLYVEMCLNRNYVCISEIAAMFPRDKLYNGM